MQIKIEKLKKKLLFIQKSYVGNAPFQFPDMHVTVLSYFYFGVHGYFRQQCVFGPRFPYLICQPSLCEQWLCLAGTRHTTHLPQEGR